MFVTLMVELSCLCKANQVHESRVEADGRADRVRLECRRDFSLRMVKGRPAAPLVPELKFCQRFLLCTTPVYKLLLAKIEQSALFS